MSSWYVTKIDFINKLPPFLLNLATKFHSSRPFLVATNHRVRHNAGRILAMLISILLVLLLLLLLELLLIMMLAEQLL